MALCVLSVLRHFYIFLPLLMLPMVYNYVYRHVYYVHGLKFLILNANIAYISWIQLICFTHSMSPLFLCLQATKMEMQHTSLAQLTPKSRMAAVNVHVMRKWPFDNNIPSGPIMYVGLVVVDQEVISILPSHSIHHVVYTISSYYTS